MLYKIISFVLYLCLAFLLLGSTRAQSSDYDFGFNVERVYPAIAITKDQLEKAKSIADINLHYKPSWIKEYISVDIFTQHQGVSRKATSKNDLLSKEQKLNIQSIDSGSEVLVEVHYIPNNDLKQNPQKTIDFSFIVDPAQSASFAEGQKQLHQYIKAAAVDKIPANTIKQYGMAAVKFSVDEAGYIYDVNMFWSTENEDVDKVLMDAICAMPNWIPAQYADGTLVSQEFVLKVGDPTSCVANMLNTSRDLSHLSSPE